MSSLSFSQHHTITIRLRTNVVMMPNLRISIQRLSDGEHRRHLCIHNGAANVIIALLLFTCYFLRFTSFLKNLAR